MMNLNTKTKLKKITKGGLLGFIGYILSPLSFWNDVLINLPLALGFSYLVTFLLKPLYTFGVAGFIVWTVIGYWISNFLGFWFIRLASQEVTNKYPGKPLHDLLISIAYTFIIVVLGVLGYQENIIEQVNIFPSWIKI